MVCDNLSLADSKTMQSQSHIRLLSKYRDVRPYLKVLCKEADDHRKELGFWRRAAYEELALQGKLWVAVSGRDDDYSGHLMFGGTYPTIRVFQLYVLAAVRRQGIARALINQLIDYATRHDFLTIRARVAADLAPANRFWEQCGFVTVKSLPGGDSRGRAINLRSRDLDTPSLLRLMSIRSAPRVLSTSKYQVKNQPILSTKSFSLDLNVLFDILKKRHGREAASAVLKAGFDNTINLSVTHEFITELRRHSTNAHNDPTLELAEHLPVLPGVDSGVLAPITRQLWRILFPDNVGIRKTTLQDRSDVRHLAMSIHHGLSGFITSDRAILRSRNVILREWYFEILSPIDFLIPFEKHQAITVPVHVQLSGAEITTYNFVENERPDVERFLSASGMDRDEIATIWQPGSIHRPRKRLCVRIGQYLVAIAAWQRPLKFIEAIDFYIVADEAHNEASTVIDHLLEWGERDLTFAGINRIELHTVTGRPRTLSTAIARGYSQSTRGHSGGQGVTLVKHTFGPVVLPSSWPKFCAQLRRFTAYTVPEEMPDVETVNRQGLQLSHSKGVVSVNLLDLETIFGPTVFLFPGRGGAIVPIRKEFAGDLIGPIGLQLDFLPSKEAIIRVEKAYYRKPRKQGFIKATAPIIFYVSGRGGGPKCAIGCGRITHEAVLPLDEVSLLYRRQGVLERGQLEQLSNTRDEIQVIIFDNFKPFPAPISLDELRVIKCISRANLVTAEQLNWSKISKICIEGFRSQRL